MPSPLEIRQRAIEEVELYYTMHPTRTGTDSSRHFAERALRAEERVEQAEKLLEKLVDVWFIRKSDIPTNPLENLQCVGDVALEARQFLNPTAQEGRE